MRNLLCGKEDHILRDICINYNIQQNTTTLNLHPNDIAKKTWMPYQAELSCRQFRWAVWVLQTKYPARRKGFPRRQVASSASR